MTTWRNGVTKHSTFYAVVLLGRDNVYPEKGLAGYYITIVYCCKLVHKFHVLDIYKNKET